MAIKRDQEELSVKDFTQMPEVLECIKELKAGFQSGKKFRVSDVVDAEGHQYVNLVQKGGGVLGVALVGYTYVLEQMGIRFIRLAGTSAGAINTALMSVIGAKKDANGKATGDKRLPKSEGVLEILCKLNFFDLVDGHPVARWIIRNFITDENFGKIISRWLFRAVLILVLLIAGDFIFLGLQPYFSWAKYVCLAFYLFTGLHLLVLLVLIFYFAYLIGRLKNAGFGINPGDFFYNWMKGLMNTNNVQNTSDLRDVASTRVPGLQYIGDQAQDLEDLDGDVTFITSEIVSQNKIEFPKMAELFTKDVNSIHPAGFVRASMAIPIFFESYFIAGIPCDDKEIIQKWKDNLQVLKDVPSTARFVDGGVLSNFPLSLFYNPNQVTPRLPSFGIDLDDEQWPPGKAPADEQTDDKSNRPESWSLGGYIYRIFNTVRFYYDKDFLIKNAFFKKGIGAVPLKGYNWLNFFMSNQQKKEMFLLGVQAAAKFLIDFDWEDYKNKRVDMQIKITTHNDQRSTIL